MTSISTPVSKGKKGPGMRANTYGDHNFKGNGVLLCRICGEPYRDHETLGPCEKAGLGLGERFTTTGRRGDIVRRTATEEETWRAEVELRGGESYDSDYDE